MSIRKAKRRASRMLTDIRSRFFRRLERVWAEAVLP